MRRVKKLMVIGVPIMMLMGGAVARNEPVNWVKMTDHAQWRARDSQGEVVYRGKMWILGGWFSSGVPAPRDVWSSADGKHYYCIECCLLRRASERVRKRDKKSKISVRQVHRAKGNGSILVDTTVTLTGIFIRDRGICQICKTKVTARQASMDHIKPIIKHGNHTWDNIQLTHLKCNLKKGDKYEDDS